MKPGAPRVGWAALLWVAPLVAAAQAVVFDIRAFQVEGNTVLATDLVQEVVNPFAGPKRSIDDVNHAAAALRLAYAQRGFPMVQVTVPEQTLAQGDVRLQVVEAKLAKVEVVGNQGFSRENIRASLPSLVEGSVVNTQQLTRAILLANENPGKQVSVNFQAAPASAEVQARVDVAEDRLQKVSATVDSYGTAATGRTRVALAYQHANLLDRDQQLSLQYTTTAEHPADVKNLVGSYHIPWYRAGLALDLVAAYSDSQSTTNAPIGQLLFSGKGSYLALRIDQGLANLGELSHKVSYGLDYKDFGNTCAVAGTSLPGTCGSVTTLPLSLAWSFQMTTSGLQAGGGVSYVVNLEGGRHGAPSDYVAARASATRHWDAVRLSGFLGLPLPAGWQLHLQAAAQGTGKSLVPAEQFGIGGAVSIRGYEERVASGDQGYNGSIEFLGPDLGKLIEASGATDLRALLFYDLGSVHRNQAFAGERVTTSLASVGTGLRLSRGKNLSAKFDWGWISRAAGTRQAHEGSANLSVTYLF